MNDKRLDQLSIIHQQKDLMEKIAILQQNNEETKNALTDSKITLSELQSANSDNETTMAEIASDVAYLACMQELSDN